MTTKEEKAATAEDVTRHAEVARAGVTGALGADETFAVMDSVRSLYNLALLGAQVPGLVAERDSALDLMRSAKATLKHLGDSHEISEHAYQELACHLDDEPCGHDGERITTRSEREVSALQARVAELRGELQKMQGIVDAAVEQRETAESERDALRAQVEVARNAFGEISTTCEQKSLLGPPQDGLSSKLFGAVDYVWKVARAQYDSLSTPPAEKKKKKP